MAEIHTPDTHEAPSRLSINGLAQAPTVRMLLSLAWAFKHSECTPLYAKALTNFSLAHFQLTIHNQHLHAVASSWNSLPSTLAAGLICRQLKLFNLCRIVTDGLEDIRIMDG